MLFMLESQTRSKHALRFWAYPAAVIVLWLVTTAFTLSQLTTVIPSLAGQGAVRRRAVEPQELRPKACRGVC
jgi:hypothetical protein